MLNFFNFFSRIHSKCPTFLDRNQAQHLAQTVCKVMAIGRSQNLPLAVKVLKD